MSETAQLLFRPKPLLLYINLSDNLNQICKDINLTYAHASKVINVFQNEGLVTKNKIGRVQHFKFTKKGEKLKQLLINVHNFFEK